MDKVKSAHYFNKLVTFLYDIDSAYMNYNYPSELRAFLTAGNKLRDSISYDLNRK